MSSATELGDSAHILRTHQTQSDIKVVIMTSKFSKAHRGQQNRIGHATNNCWSNRVAIFATLLLVSVAWMGQRAAGSKTTASNPAGGRRELLLKFPERESIGRLYVMRTPLRSDSRGMKFLTSAKDQVKIQLNPDEKILLEFSGAAFLRPQLLDGVDLSQVDCLRVQFDSLDEEEKSRSDLLIGHLSNLEKLIWVDVGRSDITDKGAERLLKNGSLQFFGAINTYIKGKFFRGAAVLPNLQSIEIINSSLSPDIGTYLARMPKLSNANLKSAGINDYAVTALSKSTSLRSLALGGNPSITDKSMPALAKMIKLRALTLEDTRVTIDGLSKLRGLKLRHLVLPLSSYPPTQMARLREYFPDADRVMQKPTVDAETKRIFAPLTRP